MSKKQPLVALAAMLAAAALAGCGAAPGSEDSGAADASDEAKSAAEALGIDLADCPGDVLDELEGEANVGLTVALSGGPAAAFAVLADGALAAFEEANETGDLPVDFNLIVKDDQFLPDKTLAAAQELIQQDKVVGFSGVTGTANALAIRDLLDEECLPAISLPAGGSVILDKEYPTILQGTTPFTLDTRVWVEYVNENYPEGAKIATFIGNTESGNDYAENIEYWLEETDSKSEIVSAETIEAADAASPSSQVTTMRNSGAEVLFAAPTGAQCTSLMTEVANQGWDPVFMMTTNCASGSYFEPAGDAADGVFTLQSFKDVTSPRFAEDPDVVAVKKVLEKYAPNAKTDNTTTYSGYGYAENFVEAAKLAAESDLGLTKLGLIVAARNLDYDSRMLIDGVKFTVKGLEDIVPIESGELNPWNAKSGGFEQGQLYQFEGELTR